MKVDRIIRGGALLNGTGTPAVAANLAIHQGRIRAIDPPDDSAADDMIDAGGQVVAPGFIDLHSHGDLVLAWPSDERLRLLEGRLAQGITTEIVGNCGLGASPLFGQALEILPHINGWMSPDVFDWSWRSLAEYFAHIQEIGLPMNVGAMAPHGPLRVGAMGLVTGESDRSSRSAMESALDKTLQEGAFGLSAGLIYPPGMYTSPDELIHLAKRLAPHDGVFTCHIRGSSETLIPAVDELLRIGFESGAAVHHSHVEAVGRLHWSKLEYFLEVEEKAHSEGIRVSRDMFPYDVAATMMPAIYPPWSLEGGLPRLLERLRHKATRRRIEQDIETVVPEWPSWRSGGWPHNLVRAVGWDRIQIASLGSKDNCDLEGMSLVELARHTGKTPFDAISDLMLQEDGNIGQFVLDVTGEAGLEQLVSRPDIAFITDANDFGKGKPHPAAYGSFPRVLGSYVRDRSVIDLPEAVRRMTSLPAQILGLKDRGELREGAWADIVIFDPERVADCTTLADPRRKPEGITAVLVNGEVVCRKGKHTGSLPGQILRKNS
jgi:N-acyl-D-amino-acid deacylase